MECLNKLKEKIKLLFGKNENKPVIKKENIPVLQLYKLLEGIQDYSPKEIVISFHDIEIIFNERTEYNTWQLSVWNLNQFHKIESNICIIDLIWEFCLDNNPRKFYIKESNEYIGTCSDNKPIEAKEEKFEDEIIRLSKYIMMAFDRLLHRRYSCNGRDYYVS